MQYDVMLGPIFSFMQVEMVLKTPDYVILLLISFFLQRPYVIDVLNSKFAVNNAKQRVLWSVCDMGSYQTRIQSSKKKEVDVG